MSATEDAAVTGFRYVKALINRYGTDSTADLLALADRLVKRGEFPNRVAAVRAIETQMGAVPTEPIQP